MGRDDEQWPVIERHEDYQNDWYTGGYDRVRQPDGTEKSYYWADLSDAVVVVARKEDELLFIRQYRPTIREYCLELPAGLVEENESYEEAARRELREETGYEAETLTLMEDYWCATGVLRHRRALVFAEGLSSVGTDYGDNEFIEVRSVPIHEALKLARREPANDATLEGIFLADADDHIHIR